MVAAIASNGLMVSIIGADDYLAQLVARDTHLRLAAVFMVVNCLSVAGIGVLAFHLLRRDFSVPAVGYLVIRIVEAVILLLGVISLLSLPSIGEAFVQAGSETSIYLRELADHAVNQNWYAYNVAMIFLGFGSLFLCYVLFVGKLIPRLLTLLGFGGYLLLGTASTLAILGIDIGLIATLPVFLFEVTFGTWLIVKGLGGKNAEFTE